MNSTLRRAISVAISLVYFLTHVALGSAAETNFWADRKLASLPSSFQPNFSPLSPKTVAVLSPFQIPKTKNKSLQEILRAVPLAYGSIQSVHETAGSQQSPVIILQDVHLNVEAQVNLSALLQNLINAKQVGAVGVEGAFYPFDFTALRAFPNKKINQDVLNLFVEKKLLSAPSYVGVNCPVEPPPFTGVDDKAQYDENVRAYLESSKVKPTLLKKISAAQSDLEEQKQTVFSPQLRHWDTLQTSFHQGRLSFGTYVRNVHALANDDDLVIDQFLSAYNMEQSLDFGEVERERQMVMGKLVKALNEMEVENLVRQSLAYQAGQVGFAAYFQFLRHLCAQNHVDLNQTPHFENYIRYVLLSEGIKAEALLSAVERQEKNILVRLVKTPEENALVEESERLTLSRKLMDFSLTAKEWKRYREITKNQDPRTNSLISFEQFYMQADLRSRSMVTNLLAEAKKENVGPMVLVVGGFHTPLLSQLLTEKNISHVIVSPKITKIEEESGSAYLSVFAREKTPLDKLFEGEKLFLSPASTQIQPHQTLGSVLLPAALGLAYQQAHQPIPVETGVKVDGQRIVLPQGLTASFTKQPGQAVMAYLPWGGVVSKSGTPRPGARMMWLKQFVLNLFAEKFPDLEDYYDVWVSPLLENALAAGFGFLGAIFLDYAQMGPSVLNGSFIGWTIFIFLHTFDLVGEDDDEREQLIGKNMFLALIVASINTSLSYIPFPNTASLLIYALLSYLVHVGVNKFVAPLFGVIEAARSAPYWANRRRPTSPKMYDQLSSRQKKRVDAFVNDFHEYLQMRQSTPADVFEERLITSARKLDATLASEMAHFLQSLKKRTSRDHADFVEEEIKICATLVEFGIGLKFSWDDIRNPSTLSWKIWRFREKAVYSSFNTPVYQVDIVKFGNEDFNGQKSNKTPYTVSAIDVQIYRDVFKAAILERFLPILGGSLSRVLGGRKVSDEMELACKSFLLRDLREILPKKNDYESAIRLSELLAKGNYDEKIHKKYEPVIDKIAQFWAYSTEIRLMSVRRPVEKPDEARGAFTALAVAPLQGFMFVDMILKSIYEVDSKGFPVNGGKALANVYETLSSEWVAKKLVSNGNPAKTFLGISQWSPDELRRNVATAYIAKYKEWALRNDEFLEAHSTLKPNVTPTRKVWGQVRKYAFWLVVMPYSETIVFQNLLLPYFISWTNHEFLWVPLAVLGVGFVFMLAHFLPRMRYIIKHNIRPSAQDGMGLSRMEKSILSWWALGTLFSFPYQVSSDLELAFWISFAIHSMYNFLVLGGKLPGYMPLASVFPLGDDHLRWSRVLDSNTVAQLFHAGNNNDWERMRSLLKSNAYGQPEFLNGLASDDIDFKVTITLFELLKNAMTRHATKPKYVLNDNDLAQMFKAISVETGVTPLGEYFISVKNKGEVDLGEFSIETLKQLRGYLLHLSELFRNDGAPKSHPELEALLLSKEGREYNEHMEEAVLKTLPVLNEKIEKSSINLADALELMFLPMFSLKLDRFREKYFEYPGKKRNVAADVFGGNGIGLSKSKTYIEGLGGHLQATSDQGETTFTVFLPPFRYTLAAQTMGATMSWLRDILFPGMSPRQYALTRAWWVENLGVYVLGALITSVLYFYHFDLITSLQVGNAMGWFMFVVGHLVDLSPPPGQRAPPHQSLYVSYFIALPGFGLSYLPLSPLWLVFTLIAAPALIHYLTNLVTVKKANPVPVESFPKSIPPAVILEEPKGQPRDVDGFIAQIQEVYKLLYLKPISPYQVLIGVASYFGLEEELRDRELVAREILAKILIQDTNGIDLPKDQFLGDIMPTLRKTSDPKSVINRYLPLALAMFNQAQGRPIFSKRGILALRRYDSKEFLTQHYPFGLSAEDAPEIHLSSGRLTQASTVRWLDFGSFPGRNGTPQLNLINDVAYFLLGKGSEVVSVTSDFPKIIYVNEHFVRSPFESVEFQAEGEAKYYGVKYLNGNLARNNITNDKLGLGKFHFISLSLEALGGPQFGNPVTKKILDETVQWTDEKDQNISSPEFILDDKQQKNLQHLMRALEHDGIIFLNLPDRQSPENRGLYLIINRSGENTFRLYRAVIPIWEYNEKFSAVPFLMKRIRERTGNRSDAFFAQLERLIRRADKLAYRSQTRDHSVYSRIENAMDFLRVGQSVGLIRVFSAYLRDVPDDDPEKLSVLTDLGHLEDGSTKPGSIFYKHYRNREQFFVTYNKWKAALGNPYWGAPLWEWIFMVPVLIGIHCKLGVLAVFFTAMLMGFFFAFAHTDRGFVEKKGLLIVGVFLTLVTISPFLFFDSKWISPLAGVGLNIFVHGVYNRLVLAKVWIFKKFPIAAIVDPDGFMPTIHTFAETKPEKQQAVIEFIEAFESYVDVFLFGPDNGRRKDVLEKAGQLSDELQNRMSDLLKTLQPEYLWESRESIMKMKSVRNELLRFGVYFSSDIRKEKEHIAYDVEFSQIVKAKEYRTERGKVRAIQVRPFGRLRLKKVVMSQNLGDKLAVVNLERVRNYTVNTVLPLANHGTASGLLKVQPTQNWQVDLIKNLNDAVIYDLKVLFGEGDTISQDLSEVMAHRFELIRWLNGYLQKMNSPIPYTGLNLHLNEQQLKSLRLSGRILLKRFPEINDGLEDKYQGLVQINTGIEARLPEYDAIVGKLTDAIAESLEVREVVRAYEGKNMKVDMVAHLNQLAISRTSGIDLMMLVTYLVLQDEDSENYKTAMAVLDLFGEHTGTPGSIEVTMDRLLEEKPEEIHEIATRLFVREFQQLVVSPNDVKAAANSSGRVLPALPVAVLLCAVPALSWSAHPWVVILMGSLAAALGTVSWGKHDKKAQALGVLKTFHVEKYFGDFRGFVGHASRIDNRSWVSWANSRKQADKLIREATRTKGGRLVLGVPQNNGDLIAALNRNRWVKAGRVEVIVGDDTITALDLMERAKSLSGPVSFVVMEGVPLPSGFFELSESEWGAFRKRATLYLVTQALQAVAIDVSLLPNLEILKEILKHA